MDIEHVSTGSMMSPMLDSPSKYGRDQKYICKKSSYQYSTTDGSIDNSVLSTERNVNQLDALLEDLKNEREQTREKDIHSSITSYRTIDPVGVVTKTTRIVKSQKLPTEVEDLVEHNTYNAINRPNPSFKDTLRNESSTYSSSKTTSGNSHVFANIYDTDSLSHPDNNLVVPSTLENDTQSLTLSDNILPIPGTKVTTTVRTYTYEIPADNNTINRNIVYKNNIYNSSRNELISDPNLPQTVIYNSESYSGANSPTNHNKSVSEKLVGASPTNQIYEINDSREYRTIRNDVISHPVHPTTKTIVYNINKTEHNTNQIQGTPLVPQNAPTYTLLPARPSKLQNQAPNPTTNYYYRESTNTVNTIQGPPADNLPPNVTIEYPNESYGPISPPNTVTYKYSSSTMNSRRGPNYDSPSSQLPPFPVEGVVYTEKNSNPPKQLNELLDSFGGDTVDSKLVNVDTNHRPKREVETAIATTNQQTIPSINKAGPAVYYPPGHEWLSKKEESRAGGYAASGKYAKASGMYEYESGYKSKSSSKSGAAVVPVCLPLCCAMPCSIM